MAGSLGDALEAFRSLPNREELLLKVIEFFPYPIQVFSLDGTARMINKAAQEMIGIRNVEAHVGQYNVFQDPIVQKNGAVDEIRRVLAGETVYLRDFNASYQDMMRFFDVVERDIKTICSDVTCFPLLNAIGEVEYFAAVIIFQEVYRGKEEIARAKQHIKDHCFEPFNAEEVAKAASLSKAYLARLFKEHTGVTPHEYYIDYRMERLKEKLLDFNLSVAQAFAACNMDYSGYAARLFRERVGVSPSVYRKIATTE